MAVTDIKNTTEKCVVQLECTSDSQQFETKTLTLENGVEIVVGRYNKKKAFSTVQEEGNILFDNRALSQLHASFCYKEGQLFVKVIHFSSSDLHSTNGTFLNGEPIGPEEINEPRVVKSGDVLRFGKQRVTLAKKEVVQPIEAKLTIKYPVQYEAEKVKKTSPSATPVEEEQIVQKVASGAQELPHKQPILAAAQSFQTLKRTNTAERATVTETAEFESKSTQSLSDANGKRKYVVTCDNCTRIVHEFYAYRKWALVVVGLCLLIIIFYQQA
uniref:FHA domain-containing protein n=1 Tax=Anopheles dirus TaxID=7168 RepID=A0A182N2P1_9DIPT